ncbi:MAG TPA: nucleotidyltransferase [Gemmatimonadaceae bacterium]|nr:nucleotidyltransferase [Gemmatimonadaceae bacterium]
MLNSHGVEYLIVGGHAVAFHGHPRFTGDMDFFIRATAANVRRVLEVLEKFGFGGLGITERDLLEPGRIVQLGQPPNRIDLLASITAIEFDAAWAARVPAEMDGVPVHLLGFDDLILNKRSAARTKDLADVEKLLAVKNRRKKSAG